MKKIRVLHFVTGGFSGATRVAIDLVHAHQQQPNMQTLLVLRRKKTTTPDKLQQLDKLGIDYQVITGATHLLTMLALKKVCQQWQPDIVVAHGFPEHLLGRRAALWAKVPHLIQVEHNSRERYTAWSLAQTRALSRHSDLVIGVSQGVAAVLAQQQLQAPIRAIANGIDSARFGGQHPTPLLQRPKQLIMVARFAKSKDHATLIHALHLLKQQGLILSLTLVGAGRRAYQGSVRKLIQQYHMTEHVHFVTHSNEVEQLLAQHQVFVMSSHFEGLNLSVLEAMASGCVVVGSRAVGVEELITHGEDGLLFPIGDAQQLARQLHDIYANLPRYQALADCARQKVVQYYDKSRVNRDYYQAFCDVLN